jgi:hypothetical protein
MLEFPALNLVRYAQLIQYAECAFFGINHPDRLHYACRDIWTYSQRLDIYNYLMMAQAQIEQAVGYPLAPRWITDERHPAKRLLTANNAWVIEPGVIRDAMIGNSAVPDYTSDPAEIVVNGVTCLPTDIHVFHNGTDDEIVPSSVVLVAGVLTIKVPWCRMVDTAYWDNPPEGWYYADVATWGADAVDVRCLTTDDRTQAVLHGRSGCSCEDEEHDGCLYVRNGKLGQMRLVPDDSCGVCGSPMVDINYRAGKVPDRISENTVLRLAHASMPTEPCGCDVTQRLWARDRNTPDVLTGQRLNCPFGMSDGAWTAWTFANSQRIVRGSMFA